MRTAFLTVLALQVAWQAAELPAQPPRELARTQAEVRGRLREPVEFHFTRTPLSDVIRKIQDQHALQTHLVKRALDDEGVATDAPVTMHLEGVSLETALQLTLEPLGLTWICRDNVLLITAMTEAEYDLTARVYPVNDLFRRGDRPPSSISHAEFDEITDLLVSVTPVCGWDDGPVGSIRRLNRSLVISHSEQHHGIYEHLLSELRRVAGRQPGQEASPEQVRIEKRLAKPVSWQFRQAGLSELAPVIERELGIPVQINKRALDDEGINVNVPVSITALRQPAAATLRRMLRPLGLSFSIVGEELLLIETQTEVEQRTFPRVYNVLDLVAEDPEDAHPWSFVLEYGPLMDAITRRVTPERWDSSSGRATLIPFRGRLVVVHDWHGHQQVAACFKNAGARRSTPIRPASSSASIAAATPSCACRWPRSWQRPHRSTNPNCWRSSSRRRFRS